MTSNTKLIYSANISANVLVKRFRPQPNVFILAAIILCYCFSTTVNAEEPEPTAEQHDQQQAIQPVTATPQPPLIDAQHDLSYEPETTDSTSVEQPVEQTVVPTPQPPLIDAQPKNPSYEPDTSKNDESATNINPATQEPPEDQASSTEATIIDELDNEQENIKAWIDSRPIQISADWVQLKSGEWLRGRIIAMQDFRLEFYSDELKKLTIKWRNVKYIKSTAPYRLRFEDQTIAVGAIEITPEEVHVITDYDDLIFDRSKLLTIASGKETELSLWSFNITVSVNLGDSLKQV